MSKSPEEVNVEQTQQMLQMMEARMAAMTDEQKAAYAAEDEKRRLPVNALTEESKEKAKTRTFLVTGANAGVGLETAKRFASFGAKTIIVLCRSQAKVDATIAAVDEARAGAGGRTLGVVCELSSVASVDAAIESVKALDGVDAIDVLVSNAGVMGIPFAQSADGIEMQSHVNHVGAQQLIVGLLPLVRAAGPGARILQLASRANMNAIRPEAITEAVVNPPRAAYHSWMHYSLTKAFNVLFVKELQRRVEGDGIIAYAVHPGFIRTELATKGGLEHDAFSKASGLTPLPPSRGADCSVYGALADGLPAGSYLENTEAVPANPLTEDETLQKQLWDVTESIIAKARS